MLTPHFTCTQDEKFVYISIKVSHIRFDAVGVQTIVDGPLFIFSLSPYYLRLRFPCELVDEEEERPIGAEYVAKEECIKVKIWKKNEGEHFPELEFSQKLLARLGEDVTAQQQQQQQQQEGGFSSEELLRQIGVSGNDPNLLQEVGQITQQEQQQAQSKGGPLIQEISTAQTNADLIETEEQGTQYSWELPQTLPPSMPLTTTPFKYGFNAQYDTIIGVSISNGNDINELNDPEHSTVLDRIKQRLSREDFKFDSEYYAADYMTTKYADEDEYNPIKELLSWSSEKFLDSLKGGFTEDQQKKMQDMGASKTYVIDDPKPLYYAILSLLFSLSFEQRQTQGELNTESAWTMGKLTPQIANLDMSLTYPDLHPEGEQVNMIKLVIVTAIRRALSFPLSRNYDLCLQTWGDVVQILSMGKVSVVKALMCIHETFRYHDVYYVYNKVLIEDLVKWLISTPANTDFILKALGEQTEKELRELKRSEICFDKLEEAQEDGEMGEIVTLDIEEIERLAEHMYVEGQS